MEHLYHSTRPTSSHPHRKRAFARLPPSKPMLLLLVSRRHFSVRMLLYMAAAAVTGAVSSSVCSDSPRLVRRLSRFLAVLLFHVHLSLLSFPLSVLLLYFSMSPSLACSIFLSRPFSHVLSSLFVLSRYIWTSVLYPPPFVICIYVYIPPLSCRRLTGATSRRRTPRVTSWCS